ncbi:MAG: hypothetical protein PVH19_12040 [Planctomycetia bacterium]
MVKPVQKKSKPKDDAGLLGVGFDANDGQVRLTRGENYALVGGSEHTHTVMQETAVKINEHTKRTGKRLKDVSGNELRDICEKVRDELGPPPESKPE